MVKRKEWPKENKKEKEGKQRAGRKRLRGRLTGKEKKARDRIKGGSIERRKINSVRKRSRQKHIRRRVRLENLKLLRVVLGQGTFLVGKAHKIPAPLVHLMSSGSRHLQKESLS